MTTESKIQLCLKKFGFKQFRSAIQEQAILAIVHGTSCQFMNKSSTSLLTFRLERRDVFISFPTGAGKYARISALAYYRTNSFMTHLDRCAINFLLSTKMMVFPLLYRHY
jgi:hypothetical protein